ncbi:MAG: hypothetical protein ACYDAQ_09450 [Mycobacteriales bacterium]
MEFADIEQQLRDLIEIMVPGRGGHPEYPFWRLQADGIWEIPDAADLPLRSGNSDPTPAELRTKRVQGGFPRPYYVALRADRRALDAAVRIAASKLPDDTRQEIMRRLGWKEVLDDPALDTEYVDVGQFPLPKQPVPSEPDPDLFGRGLQAHRATQTALATWLTEQGLEPRSPARADVAFDILWRCDGLTVVCEVKSITDTNEERQLRLGLGQLLRYRQAAHRQEAAVIAALVIERAPRDETWVTLCHELGCLLVWPETFPVLLETGSVR